MHLNYLKATSRVNIGLESQHKVLKLQHIEERAFPAI